MVYTILFYKTAKASRISKHAQKISKVADPKFRDDITKRVALRQKHWVEIQSELQGHLQKSEAGHRETRWMDARCGQVWELGPYAVWSPAAEMVCGDGAAIPL